MAFDKMQRYMVRFRLPDGEHIAAAHSTQDVVVARREIARAIRENPEAKIDPEADITPVEDHTVIVRAVEELRARDPSRPLADNLGLDTPNRVLTNPEVVPGSKVMRVEPDHA